jgi:hypothetical protein
MDTASSESTPLLSGKFQTGSHNDIEQHIATDSRAKPHLRIPITILTVLVALLSLSTFGLLVATHILMDTGPFYGIWEPELVVRDQAIIVRGKIPGNLAISHLLLTKLYSYSWLSYSQL